MQAIHALVDQCFAAMREADLPMTIPGEVYPEMRDDSIPPEDDWRGWKPMYSVVTVSDLDRFEAEIGFALPPSYRTFLLYKHFYELSIPDRAVTFPAHLPEPPLGFLREYVLDSYYPELIHGRGYLFFADFEDYGLLCFDTNHPAPGGEYRIVFIDHEDLEDIHPYAPNFQALLEGDEETGNRFIEELNAFYAEEEGEG